MARRPPVHDVTSASEMAAVVFPVRQEILDVLAGLRRGSVAEIAATLGTAPDALYYHVKALVKCGLVLPAGERGAGRSREALYETVSPVMRLRYKPSSSARNRGVSRIVGSMLRLADRRSLARALGLAGDRLAGAGRDRPSQCENSKPPSRGVASPGARAPL